MISQFHLNANRTLVWNSVSLLQTIGLGALFYFIMRWYINNSLLSTLLLGFSLLITLQLYILKHVFMRGWFREVVKHSLWYDIISFVAIAAIHQALISPYDFQYFIHEDFALRLRVRTAVLSILAIMTIKLFLDICVYNIGKLRRQMPVLSRMVVLLVLPAFVIATPITKFHYKINNIHTIDDFYREFGRPRTLTADQEKSFNAFYKKQDIDYDEVLITHYISGFLFSDHKIFVYLKEGQLVHISLYGL